jgi:hypothetical protein
MIQFGNFALAHSLERQSVNMFCGITLSRKTKDIAPRILALMTAIQVSLESGKILPQAMIAAGR